MQRKRIDNRGFSLVELIIVIAIMAALVAVLAVSFIRYVGKSREAVCFANMQGVTQAYLLEMSSAADFDYSANLKTAISDNPAYVPVGPGSAGTNSYSVKLDGLCPSKGSCTVTIDVETGVVTTLYCSVHGAEGLAGLTAAGTGTSPLSEAYLALLNSNSFSFNRTIDSTAVGTTRTPKIVEALRSAGYEIGPNTVWRIVAQQTTRNYCVYMVDLTDEQLATMKLDPTNLTVTGGVQVYYSADGSITNTVQNPTLYFSMNTEGENKYPVISNRPNGY